MQTYTDNVLDRLGNALSGVEVTVYESDGTTKASFTPNPITTESNGEYSFTLANGKYIVSVSHPSIQTKTRQVVLFDPDDEEFPDAGEKAALAGTSGTPGAGNPFVTSDDPRIPTQDENDSFPAGASSGDPLALASDTRFPTADEKAALAGTGTPSASNPFANKGDIVRQVADYAAAQALTGLSDGDQVSIAEEGRGGIFVYRTRDFTTEATADTLSGVYLPLTADSDGSEGCLVRRAAILFPEFFGARGDGTTDDTASWQAFLDYLAENGDRGDYAAKPYRLTTTLQFPIGSYHLDGPEWKNIENTAEVGFIWDGSSGDVVVEILEIQRTYIRSILVNNRVNAVADTSGILWHNSDNTGTASNHNKIGTIAVSGCKYGVRLGDLTNDTYNSNIDDNLIEEMLFYDTLNPLLIDSLGQDNNKILYFHAGGVPTSTVDSRDFVIRSLKNGIGFAIDLGFAVATNIVTDTAAIDIQDGSFSCGQFSIESTTNSIRAIDISSAATRDQSILQHFVTSGIKDSSGVAAKFGARSGQTLIGCSFQGDIEYSRPLTSIGTVLIDGDAFVADGSLGSLVEVGTSYRANASSIPTQSRIMSSQGYKLTPRSTQSGATVFTNVNLGGVFPVLLSQNASISAPTSVVDSRDIGREIEYQITGDASSAYTVTFNAVFKLAGGAYTHSGVGKLDIIAFRWDGTNWIETRRSMDM